MIRKLIVVIALVGFGAFAWSCNEEGSLSLEEYFEKVDELDDQQQSRSQELEDALDELGDEATVGEIADSFDQQVEVVNDFREDMDGIEPPEEAEELHQNVLDTLEAAAEQLSDLLDQFREADSVEEGFALFEEANLDAVESADAACRELEQLATDNNIEVDFNCDDE